MSSTGETPAPDFASSSIDRGSSGADASPGAGRRVRRDQDGGQEQGREAAHRARNLGLRRGRATVGRRLVRVARGAAPGSAGGAVEPEARRGEHRLPGALPALRPPQPFEDRGEIALGSRRVPARAGCAPSAARCRCQDRSRPSGSPCRSFCIRKLRSAARNRRCTVAFEMWQMVRDRIERLALDVLEHPDHPLANGDALDHPVGRGDLRLLLGRGPVVDQPRVRRAAPPG